MIGRLLCRLGWHRWDFGTAVDPVGKTSYTLVTYSWCKRPLCLHPITIVDVEERIWR